MASFARTPLDMRRDANFGSLLRSGASLLAVCAFAAATPAFAQNGSAAPQGGAGTAGNAQQGTAPAPDANAAPAAPENSDQGAIVVTGIRQSLANSQNIKRNSDTVVDAITASDIGALPDRSVTEALQRVPGVEMNRFAGNNDPDHFSVEGSGVVVRGLTFVRSEFNGRDTFSAGVYGQAINFADVPSELLGSVEVYKNSTAETIEGGLAGTVNLNTRLPFDNKGFHVAFDIEANEGDMRKKATPTGSVLVSDTFDTGIGRIGFLGDLSYSRLKSRSDGIQVTNFQTRDNTLVVAADTVANLVCRNPLPSNTDTTKLPPSGAACGTASTAGADGLADNAALRYAPLGGQFRTEDYDRIRKGIDLAAQWESLDRRAHLTLQFLRTDSSNKWGEHTFESGPDLSEYNTYPAGCRQNTGGPGGSVRAECPTGALKNYTYDANNVFESGFITLPGTGWRSADSGGAGRVTTGGMQQSLSTRNVDERNVVNDFGANFKFSPNSHWDFALDGDYTRAQHDDLDMSVFGSLYADEQLDITGSNPVIIPHKPLNLSATWATPNPRIAGETDSQYFNDPANEFWRAAMDHIEHSTGHEWAFKGDGAYKFDDGSFLNRLKFGARYADREETIRYTTYNWAVLSEVWDGNGGPVWMDQTPRSQIASYSFNNFFRNEVPGPPGGFFYSGNLIDDYRGASTFFQSVNQQWIAQDGGSQGWVPLASRAGVIPGTPFLPSEIEEVSQKNTDGYLMLNFGNDNPLFGDVRLSGNVGVRFVNTRVRSQGIVQITAADLGVTQDFDTRCKGVLNPTLPPGVPPGTATPQPSGICALTRAQYQQLQTFASAPATSQLTNTSNDQWLPSLNLKFGVGRDVVVRFAASRVMTLPDLASIRNSLTASFDTTSGIITFNVGNPNLKPMTANQFDVTAEWYFARVGSLTFDAFYKDVTNYFYTSTIFRNFTQNGITQAIAARGPANYSGHGKIKGFEVAYQQTFDFLPKPLDGLGVSANYTYIESTGLPNSYLNTGSPAHTSTVLPGNLPLEQLSKHNVNVQVFYEKGPISLRVAYNWRSRFLLTASDVIFPYYPIFNEAAGYLDASAFINITKQIKVGVQGVNLLNTITKTSQQFTTGGLLGPRSYYMNDRRYSLILRASF
ncbi:MAG TPA: TonB-dependent receptor [Allosphingosinicella sp.]|jgi:TonB-dependent receptor|nr:TonB-dependent receptor [Allosphingosinicella sp.]